MTEICPKGCGLSLDDQDYFKHFSTSCPNVTVLCPYGCNTSFARSEMQYHKFSCASYNELESKQILPKPSVNPIIYFTRSMQSLILKTPTTVIQSKESDNSVSQNSTDIPDSRSTENKHIPKAKDTIPDRQDSNDVSTLIQRLFINWEFTYANIEQVIRNMSHLQSLNYLTFAGLAVFIVYLIAKILKFLVFTFCLYSVWKTLNTSQLKGILKHKTTSVIGFAVFALYLHLYVL